MASVKEIDALLPQTQCKECGYPGCLPYAQALAQGNAPIDRCPPGGVTTLKALGSLLKINPEPYMTTVNEKTRAPQLAEIREAECIGCTKCIQACPVDAIIGSGKLMHSILTDECTGCGLCIEPCPVDCIDLVPVSSLSYKPDVARKRFNAKAVRLIRDDQEKQQAYREKTRLNADAENQQREKQAKQDYILQALQRVRNKKT